MHAVAAALARDDLDRALDSGLLEVVPCPTCDAACVALVASARTERVGALAARERFRARQARLARRAQERAASRAAPVAAADRPQLPAAAADVLARALARAKGDAK